MWLKHLHAVRAQIFVDGICGILEIGELTSTGRTVLAASGGEPLGYTVIAEGAFFRGFLGGMNEAAPVGTGLNAITAAQTISGINEDDAFWRIECGADR